MSVPSSGVGWIERGANLLLFGPPSVGKSNLACAIGNGLIDRGYRVHFARIGDLVQRLQVARREMRLPAEIAKLDRFDLLILDDLSYVRRDQTETSVLFELIAARTDHLLLWHQKTLTLHPTLIELRNKNGFATCTKPRHRIAD